MAPGQEDRAAQARPLLHVALAGGDPDEAILRDVLHDKTDLVGVPHQHQARTLPTQVGDQIADAGDGELLGARPPALCQKTLHKPFVAAGTGEFSKRS